MIVYAPARDTRLKTLSGVRRPCTRPFDLLRFLFRPKSLEARSASGRPCGCSPRLARTSSGDLRRRPGTTRVLTHEGVETIGKTWGLKVAPILPASIALSARRPSRCERYRAPG